MRILVDGQEQTWIKDLNQSESYLAAFSDGSLGKSESDPFDHRKVIFSKQAQMGWKPSKPENQQGNHVYFRSFEGFGGLIPTTISAFEHILNNQSFDFILRTNVSSYWNMSQLRRTLANLPSTNVFAGVTGPAHSGISGKFKSTRYVSGAGMIISRDVATKLVENYRSLDLKLIDDVSIGRSIAKFGVKTMELPRIDVRHKRDINDLSLEEIQECAHYRCKSDIQLGRFSYRNDVALMKLIHKRLHQNESR
jgi:hypothetical protein